MTILFVVVAIAIVAGVAVLVVRDRPLLVDDPVGGRALRWDAAEGVTGDDLADVRFAIALRGYRMSEVDRVLADTQAALGARDAQISELRRVVEALGSHAPDDSAAEVQDVPEEQPVSALSDPAPTELGERP